VIEEKSHIRWQWEYLGPSHYKDFKSWALWGRGGEGIFMFRVLGLTVKVIK